jgi:hypothetical protein
MYRKRSWSFVIGVEAVIAQEKVEELTDSGTMKELWVVNVG